MGDLVAMDSTSPFFSRHQQLDHKTRGQERPRKIKTRLKDEKADAGLCDDLEGLESVLIGLMRDVFVVNLKVADASMRDGACKTRLLSVLLDDKRDIGVSPHFLWLPLDPVDEILELGAANLRGTNAKRKADGINDVGLSCWVAAIDFGERKERGGGTGALASQTRSVGTNDALERKERADDMLSFVRLEVLEFDLKEAVLDKRHLEPLAGCWSRVESPCVAAAAAGVGGRRGFVLFCFAFLSRFSVGFVSVFLQLPSIPLFSRQKVWRAFSALSDSCWIMRPIL